MPSPEKLRFKIGIKPDKISQIASRIIPRFFGIGELLVGGRPTRAALRPLRQRT
jgi:hypothetical protein